MPQIDYYFSVLSPFCYLASDRLEQICSDHGYAITYKPVDTLTLYDRIGSPRPNARWEGRQAYRLQELARLSKQLDMPLTLNPAHWPTNAAPASYAVIAAQTVAQREGKGDVGLLVRLLLGALWAEERDVAEDAVIADCLEGAGFSRALTMTGMLEGAEAYPRNLEDAVAAGVFGVPFYITPDDQRFWGQDRLRELDMTLQGAL
ncbi:2-hydroxychromene-2-carboxylate isomerase [Aquimixticola soesokkakensis]|uniref:2-hydroxychromene-2-carboxylate isomerase n=1 Tax=Aquimixticola soesokkakensis TaxID=1519096 RepID=A0A1Y5RLU6_9RHOB|nr:2-hydroxychromene-2-carboxylate isomerase [Aquimixticola soesokkakensis]SLN20466.1 2-hydroxychromene-2-carboxylate isomerase [Aquimixticola soesokkakensis]